MAADITTGSIKVPGTNILLAMDAGTAEAKTLVIARAYSGGADLGNPGQNIQVRFFSDIGGTTAIDNGSWQISATGNQFPIILPLTGLGVKSVYIYCNGINGTGGISGCLFGV